jgi:hypothetical protein
LVEAAANLNCLNEAFHLVVVAVTIAQSLVATKV